MSAPPSAPWTLALPRGATLTSAVLHVAPHSGPNGALSVNVRAAVECDGGPHATAPLGLESSAQLQQLDGPTVPWTCRRTTSASARPTRRPTFPADAAAARAEAGTPECAVVLVLDPVERGADDGGGGTRVFYGPETCARRAPAAP